MNDNRYVAQTIFDQLGAYVFKIATGAHHFSHTYNSLKFWFQDCNKADVCRITLNGLDLYDIEFFKSKATEPEDTTVKTYENIYCDQLTDLFEDFTGLRTSL